MTTLAEPVVALPPAIGDKDRPDHHFCCDPLIGLCGFKFEDDDAIGHDQDCGHDICAICEAAADRPCGDPLCPGRSLVERWINRLRGAR